MMTNLLNNRTQLLGSAALVAVLVFSTQSSNAQGFSHQPNRHAVPSYHGATVHHKAKPTQSFVHQSPTPKKVGSHKAAQILHSRHHNMVPAVAMAPCHHQPALQVVIIGQPKKPNLIERIVNVFR